MANLAIPTDRDPALVAEVGFAPAFSVTLEYDEQAQVQTPRGGRIYHRIAGGSVSGRITGTVYPTGAGEYSLQRGDGVIDHRGYVLLRDEAGEWVYLHNMGYQRPDGYFRVTSWVDADVRSRHSWVLGLFFIGIGRPAGPKSVTIDYYEVL